MAADKFLLAFLFLLESLLFTGNCDTKTCDKIDDCSCKKSNGETMSLHPIDGKSGPKFSGIKMKEDGKIKDFVLSWNPCTKFNGGEGCRNVLLCQATTGSSPVLTYPIGKTVKSFTENDADGSIIVLYEESTYEDYSRQGILTLKCDQEKDPGELTEFTEKKTTTVLLQYSATFSSKCVCDGGCPDVHGESGSSGGLSTGSILLIVFFPLVFIYFVGGVLYNKYQKGVNTFGEMIPNHSFWSDLPFLVKDGCVLTFHCVAGCCNSLCMKIKGDSYAKI